MVLRSGAAVEVDISAEGAHSRPFPSSERCWSLWPERASAWNVSSRKRFDYETLAARTKRSPRMIQLSFAEHTKTMPIRYFQALKLHRAREALLADSGDSAAPISELAAAHGRPNRSGLTKLSRQQFGETPSQTRKKRID